MQRNNIPVGGVIGGALRPSLSFGNFLIIFVPMLLLLITLLQITPKILIHIAEKLPELETGDISFAPFVLDLIKKVFIIAAVFILFWLFSVYQMGVLVHNIGNKLVGKPKPYSQSLLKGLSRYPSLFAAMLLISILATLVASIPYIGWLLTLAVACIFWVTYQGITLDELGFADGLKRSYQYLRKHTFHYISIFIITLIIAITIGAISLIPMGIAIIPKILTIATTLEEASPAEALHMLAGVLTGPTIYVASIITCAILTLGTLYTTYGIPTKLYLEIRRTEQEEEGQQDTQK